MLAETDEKSGEKNYNSKRRDDILRNIRIPVAVTLIAFIFLFSIVNAPLVSTSTYILLGLKAIGMVISTLLFVKSIDNASSLVNKLCNAGSKISCQSILDSPAAKITPWFSWSDAGFIYFFGSFIALLFSLNDASNLQSYWILQMVFSCFSIIFSSYSLYYQGIKAKMWCTLCLGVVAVFSLEALLTFTFFLLETYPFSLSALLQIGIGFILPVAFLILLKKTNILAQESKSYKKQLFKLKSNPDVFEALMANQKQMPEIPADMPVITIGNKNAEHTITMVSNPLCSPCAHMHARIEKIIKENDNLKCEVIFLSDTDEQNAGGQFVRKLLSLPEYLHAEGLHHWFSANDRNYERWDKNYLKFKKITHHEKSQLFHNDWVNNAEVKGTPTLFINGNLLSEVIRVEDLVSIAKIKRFVS